MKNDNKEIRNTSIEDISGEIWKDILGFEKNYQVSNKGRVKSLTRPIKVYSKIKIYKTQILKYSFCGKGYPIVNLSTKPKNKTFKIHRLVAIHFIPNPENKPQVNHKNGIKTDNRVENLEWCDGFENMNHAFANGLFPKRKGVNHPLFGRRGSLHKGSKKVKQLDLDGNIIQIFSSTREAEKVTGVLCQNIGVICLNKRTHKTAGGFKWEYV